MVRRPIRRPAPEMPSGELVLDAPPELPTAPGRGWTQVLMVLPMVAMMAAMVLLFSGNGTALRSIITSLALTHTPREVQFYCLDFGGGSLSSLRGLPHVGGVAGRQNVGAVRRTIAEVSTVVSERERRFAEDEVDGMAAYRENHPEDDRYGDVFLVVDGWLTLRKDFEDLEDVVGAIAARGLAYGVHIVATCSRSFDLRPNVRDLFGSRIELRLGDPVDTTVDRMSALDVPDNSPGRGIASTGHQLLMALPRVDGRDTVDDLPAGVSTLVGQVAESWQGEPAPNVRLLPPKLAYAALPPRDDPAGHRLTIGIAEQDLAPVQLDFAADAHLMLLGDADSGKTAFLRSLAKRITESYSPEQARILLVDHRRGLLGEVGQEHLLGYGTDLATTTRLMNEAAGAMAQRLPGPDVTPEQLRARNWWQGPASTPGSERFRRDPVPSVRFRQLQATRRIRWPANARQVQWWLRQTCRTALVPFRSHRPARWR
ncbi:S-DNA-T family DNA segregation ATPase FtsK/SpoIIIE [Amycolatopsis sulphurea]|uniref:S-DNA-T family DNA segregation ATPase FtsK/SpoIIIE n=1 Tax=Amycolatopsis sulphurea TaxID=76022 RepID=A0A2A9FFZ2_9PSEU|nr:type VII secretion protein EccCb [Amycolatopsis sulphurea]PFG49345.1 S-DNA-T family DNA segregation ATPase FtsK/SpoIIIE [Amycolatopsis sulphurea]